MTVLNSDNIEWVTDDEVELQAFKPKFRHGDVEEQGTEFAYRSWGFFRRLAWWMLLMLAFAWSTPFILVGVVLAIPFFTMPIGFVIGWLGCLPVIGLYWLKYRLKPTETEE